MDAPPRNTIAGESFGAIAISMTDTCGSSLRPRWRVRVAVRICDA